MTTEHFARDEHDLEVLTADPLVREAAVLADEDPLLAPTLLVVSQGYVLGPALRQRVLQLLPDAWGGVRVAVVRSIPRDASGLLDEAEARRLVDRSGWVFTYQPASTPTEHQLVSLLAEILPDVQVSMTDGLIPLGLDSLAAVDLLESIREVLRVDLSASDLYDAVSVGDLARRIDELPRMQGHG